VNNEDNLLVEQRNTEKGAEASRYNISGLQLGSRRKNQRFNRTELKKGKQLARNEENLKLGRARGRERTAIMRSKTSSS